MEDFIETKHRNPSCYRLEEHYMLNGFKAIRIIEKCG